MLLLKNCSIADVIKGRFIDGDILIEEGKIKYIGNNNIILNEDIKVIDIKNNKVFPGFIDAHSHIGIWNLNYDGNDANECIDPITPGLRAIDGLNPVDDIFNDAIKSGITTVMITPGSGNVICGQAAIIKTYGKSKKEIILKSPAALKMALGENPKNVYKEQKKSPSSRMGTAFLIRKKFSEAMIYMEKKKENPDLYDIDLEPIALALKGDISIKIHAHRSDDILTAINIIKEYNLRGSIDHCTEGYLVLDELKRLDFPILVGPLFSFRTKDELKNASYENPIKLIENGLNVSFTSDHPFTNCKYLSLYVGLLVKHGLSYFDAIKTITINPAKSMGFEDRLGSIDVGKDADLVVYDGDPLEASTNTLITIIDGEIVYPDTERGDI